MVVVSPASLPPCDLPADYEEALDHSGDPTASQTAPDPDRLARSVPTPMVFVDLETTGGNALVDRITEIGVVEIGPHGIEQWSTLLDPAESIPPFIQQLTGITNEMVRGQPSFGTLAEGLAERLHGKLFVAHNARFDYGFLKNEFRRAGVAFQADVLCTVRLSRLLFPAAARHGLDALIARFGLAPQGRHRALADADLLWQFWQRIHTLYSPELIEQAVKRVVKRASQPPQLPDEAIDALPDRPGVYLFYGANDALLYVGKSVDIRARVRSHFSSDHLVAKDLRISQEIRRVESRTTAGELGALLLESQLVKQLQPIHNRMLRRTSQLYSWQLVEAMHTPVIVNARSVDFASADTLFGTFSSRTKAEHALQSLADEHGLCCARLGLEKTAPGRPCFGYQVKRCQGVCVGQEAVDAHTARLREALTTLRLDTWPYPGPIAIEERSHDDLNANRDTAVTPPRSQTGSPIVQFHVIDRWQYLGSVNSRDALEGFVDAMPAVTGFDPDVYRLLGRRLAKLEARQHESANTPPTPDDAPSPAAQARHGWGETLVIHRLDRPGFRLSEPTSAVEKPVRRTTAGARRPKAKPEDPAQMPLPIARK